MKNFKKISPIRDVIHDYMPFSVFEREIIDTPYFQRLHSILQNSSAYVTYPSNRNTRFAHSLGVAYLGGRMFTSGLSHASKDDLHQFLKSVNQFLMNARRNFRIDREDAPDKIQDVWRLNIGNISGFRHDPFSSNSGVFDPEEFKSKLETDDCKCFDPLFLINTLFLSVRISALFHDIGHLPTSHVFENSLDSLDHGGLPFREQDQETKERCKQLMSEVRERAHMYNRDYSSQYWKDLSGSIDVSEDVILSYVKTKAVHEVRGLSIIHKYLTSFNDNHNHDHFINTYRELIVYIAQLIISHPDFTFIGNSSQFLYTLKKLIDSELDADRLDYTMRDPHVSGLEIGQLDKERIIDSVVLSFKKSSDEKDGTFLFCLNRKAVSNVEQLYHQRALGYQNLIYHRGNVRSQAVLETIISLTYKLAIRNEENPFTEQLAEFGFLSLKELDSRIKIEQLVPSDENSLMLFDDNMFRAYLAHMIKSGQKYRFRDLFDKHILELIISLSKVFVFRDYRSISTAFRDSHDPKQLCINYRETDHESEIQDVLSKYNYECYRNKHPSIAMYSSTKPKTYKKGKQYPINIVKTTTRRYDDIYIYENSSINEKGKYSLKSISEYSGYLSEQSNFMKEHRNYFVFLFDQGENRDQKINELEKELIEVINSNAVS